MMQTLFGTIIKMSAVGSVIYLMLCLIKPITERIFSSTWHFYTKFFIILVLLISFPLHFTAFEISIPGEHLYFKDSTVPVFSEAQDFMENNTQSHRLLVKQSTEQALTAFVKSLTGIIAPGMQYIWLCGVIVFFLLKLKSYFQFRNILIKNVEIKNGKAFDMLSICKYEMGIKRKIRLVRNNSVGTPMLIGLFKPTIIIPEVEIRQNELRFIFTHELVHYKRGDLWIKASVLIVRILHWFNPVFLLMAKDINRLCELSCDEAVVKRIDFPSRKKYAATIIYMLDKRIQMSGVIYSAMNENAENLKRRLNSMLNYKKPNKARLIFSITAAVTIFVLAISASAAMIHPIETYAESIGGGGNIQADTETASTKQPGTEQTDKVPDDTILVDTEPVDSAIAENKTSEQDNISKPDEKISMVWPVPDSKIISAVYGKRIHPVLKKETMHTGIDIAGKTWYSIVAAEDGDVITAEWKDDYGYYLVIKHSSGITTFYSHCSKLLVKKGEEVAAGQNIAIIGRTGMATGPHLHFEVSKDGEIQNPMDYVSLPNSN